MRSPLFCSPTAVSPNRAPRWAPAAYQTILETADSLCREMGYRSVVKLTPPTIPFADMGLYWSTQPETITQEESDAEPSLIHMGPGRVEMLKEGLLLDARLSQLGVDEVTRQHFKIPVTASDGVINLMQRAVASAWPNDFKGVWHDILGMCVVTGKDISPTERQFPSSSGVWGSGAIGILKPRLADPAACLFSI